MSLNPNASSSSSSSTTTQSNSMSIEESEEAKLKQKYPNLNRKSIGSSVLQKRLSNKGQKYFDSGDYNMAKAKVGGPGGPGGHRVPSRGLDLLQAATGDTIATPDSVPAVRKKSLIGDQLLLLQSQQHTLQLQSQHRKPSIALADESMVETPISGSSTGF